MQRSEPSGLRRNEAVVAKGSKTTHRDPRPERTPSRESSDGRFSGR